jgi:hypothetical protein
MQRTGSDLDKDYERPRKFGNWTSSVWNDPLPGKDPSEEYAGKPSSNLRSGEAAAVLRDGNSPVPRWRAWKAPVPSVTGNMGNVAAMYERERDQVRDIIKGVLPADPGRRSPYRPGDARIYGSSLELGTLEPRKTRPDPVFRSDALRNREVGHTAYSEKPLRRPLAPKNSASGQWMDWRGTHQRDSSGERVLDRDEREVVAKITTRTDRGGRSTLLRDRHRVTPKITSLNRGRGVDQEN